MADEYIGTLPTFAEIMRTLQPSPEEQRRANMQALAAAGLSLLGAPKGREWQALGNAGMVGLSAQRQYALDAAQRAAQQIAMQQHAMQLAQAYQTAGSQQAVANGLKGMPTASTPAAPTQGMPSLAPTPANAADLASRQAAAATQSATDPFALRMRQADYWEALAAKTGNPAFMAEATKARDDALKFRNKRQGVTTAMINGQPTLMQPTDYGPPEVITGMQPKPEIHWADTGSSIQPINQLTLQAAGASIPKSMAPGEQERLNLERARLGLEQANQNKPQIVVDQNSGAIFAVNPRTGTGAPVLKEGTTEPLSKGEKPLSEAQANAVAYGSRMASANQTIGELERSGHDLAGLSNLLAYNGATNYLASSEAQKLYQAKLNFMTASLRKESGAVISPTEFASEDKKYFPQPGDSQEVIAQKRRARELAINVMAQQAGRGASKVPSGAGASGGWSAKRID